MARSKKTEISEQKDEKIINKSTDSSIQEVGIASYIIELYKEERDEVKDKNKILKESIERIEKTKRISLNLNIILFIVLILLSGYIIFTWDYFHPTIGIIKTEKNTNNG